MLDGDPAGDAFGTHLPRITDINDAGLERSGDPADVVPGLAEEVGARTIFAAEDFGPYGRRRDDAVAAALGSSGRELRFVGSPYAVRPGTIETKGGGPFKVFTPFSKAWRAHGWEDPQGAADVDWRLRVRSDPRPPTPTPDASDGLPAAGERAAWDLADAFLSERVDGYRDDRNLPGYKGDLNTTCRTMAEMLKPAGYGTYAVGKWHLTPEDEEHMGARRDRWPPASPPRPPAPAAAGCAPPACARHGLTQFQSSGARPDAGPRRRSERRPGSQTPPHRPAGVGWPRNRRPDARRSTLLQISCLPQTTS